MTNSEITKTLQKLNGIWGNLERKTNRDRYREYGEFLKGYKFDYMNRAIEVLRGASTFLPKQAELKDIYKIEIRKEEEQQKMKEETAKRERDEAEEYQIKCMVCLDHGVIWRDEVRKINGTPHKFQISYYCDKCDRGRSMAVMEIRHDERGREIANECIDKPISAVMDTEIIAERNAIKYQDTKLINRPAGVYMRMDPVKVSAESLARGRKMDKEEEE